MYSEFKLLPDALAIEDAGSKAAILTKLSHRFAQAYGLCADTVHDALEERERLGSTGFGRGVALPHARIEGIHRPVAALVKLETPVDFAAADAAPVDIVVGLLSPLDAGATHLHALAALSRMLRDDAMHQALEEAASPDELYAVLADVADRDAA